MDEFGNFSVGEDDAGIVLEGVEVMARKAFAFLAGDHQGARLPQQGVHGGVSQRFLFVEGFVHGDDELGHGLEPGKPGIGGEEAQEVVGRLDGPDGFLVGDTLGFDERFVQSEQGVSNLRQAFRSGGFHVAGNVSHLKGGCKRRMIG